MTQSTEALTQDTATGTTFCVLLMTQSTDVLTQDTDTGTTLGAAELGQKMLGK